MSDTVDVAIVGAGPYGLSLSAHLRSAGIEHRQFGVPLSLWRTAMPRGMYLKSQGFASSLSDPDRTHTLGEFCERTGRPYADLGKPVSLDTFLAYGSWFEQHRAPGVERVLVDDIKADDEGYELYLSDGERARARNVVIATGVEHFARMPTELSGLPSQLCTHSSAHVDLDVFRDREVLVVGAGQSGLETAALLRESGASVRLVARADSIAWNTLPLERHRAPMRRIREPEAGLGSGWSTLFYSECPWLFRHLPKRTRMRLARTALGPAGAWWLRERVEGQVPLMLERRLEWAASAGNRVRLGLRDYRGQAMTISAEHVISATGYRPDLSRLPFLNDELRRRLSTLDDTPMVDRDYRSAVPGLYFIGPVVTPTMGPVMRFVYGSDHAAKCVTAGLSRTRQRSPIPTGGALR